MLTASTTNKNAQPRAARFGDTDVSYAAAATDVSNAETFQVVCKQRKVKASFLPFAIADF
ncbi:hypothetical protein [Serratia marcescens]|uniref:hypothetical protein n=1 Tax=Serratia marcescens TaxID=615 RepID=UPI003A86809F